MKYDHSAIEDKWQKFWAENQTFKAKNPSDFEKGEGSPLGGGGGFYVLDMFPYPSGAGLHVGHPLGYIASDIYARYKRHKGFNVLHPQGYDSFGLPAEQYAIQTGQHPSITTATNIKRYREQLDKIGFSFDWSREVCTSDPSYYKWTQWIFIQLFESWYNMNTDKAEPIPTLVAKFEADGNALVNAICDEDTLDFSAEAWQNFTAKQKQEILLQYRLTYLAETEVNWCPELGTVLANDEIVNGVSERGGHPVVRKKMTQWSMRISAYAQRLLDGLDHIDWPQPLKDSQRNWIGRSVGAQVDFKILPPAPSHGGGVDSGSIRDSSINYKKESVSKVLPMGEDLGGDRKHSYYLTGKPEIVEILLQRAQEMRANPTKAEAKLWQALRNGKLDHKFRQQHPIDQYIVDFVCLSKMLIIEVDGDVHQYQLEKDGERQLLLEQKRGYRFLRFTNKEVLENFDGVIEKIKETLKLVERPDSTILPPAPSHGGGADPAHNQNFNSDYDLKSGLKVLPMGEDLGGDFVSVFTTRPDTIFGVTFMTLAPEHELVPQITTPAQRGAVEAYIAETAKRSERDRMADVKTITGVFTGAYAEHPFTQEPVPIWIGDYVLAGYGTGAVMAVPCGDQRDHDFAMHFADAEGMLPIKNIFRDVDVSETAHVDKEGTVIANSDFLNDMPYKKAVKAAIHELEKIGLGTGKINYRLRDAVFSRQRYWGEPFPVYYVDGMPQMIDEKYLPLHLPEVEKYLPTEEGEPPLGRADVWAWDTTQNKIVSNEHLPPMGGDRGGDNGVYPLELNTMPGWAGSSWYFFRYMDAHNEKEFASAEALRYWENVDLYIGGSEHATGHLLYSRFWVKFLKDRGFVNVEEPFKKLINQGMILGESAFVYRVEWYWSSSKWSDVDESKAHNDNDNLKEVPKRADYPDIFVPIAYFQQMGYYIDNYKYSTLDCVQKISSFITKIENDYKIFNRPGIGEIERSLSLALTPIHVPIEFVNNSNYLDTNAFKNWRPEFKNSIFIGENGEEINDTNNKNNNYIVGREVEKMSKSKYNVVNPDDICDQYGADTLRMYEMFLGPLEQAKPWNTAGITGVYNFLKKFWKLYHKVDQEGNILDFQITENPPKGGAGGDFRILHKTIKKVQEDIENFSFNTSVSAFMVAVNELSSMNCNSREILEPLCILLSPYAPHIAEELWSKLGHNESISTAPFPIFEEKYLRETSKEYPISFNGKMRFTMELPLDLSKDEIEKAVLENEKTQEYLAGRIPKKTIIVPGKIVNFVG